MKRRSRDGFTLMELVTVVIIIAILAAIGAQRYQQMLEQHRADVAKGILESIATANRAWAMTNNNTYITGALSNASTLVTQGKLAGPDWNQTAYVYTAAAAAVGPCSIASAVRRAGASPPGTNVAPYTTWSFCVNVYGRWQNTTGTVCACP